MSYHFTTTHAHITKNGGKVVEIFTDEALKLNSDHPFKGNIDIEKLIGLIREVGAENVPFVRMEAGTNLIGGQPFSLANLREVRKVCDEYGIKLVLDASLLQDNLYFIKQREDECKNMTIREITRQISDLCDIIYFSARKLGFARGGGIITDSEEDMRAMREYVTLYEGFLTYGGMSVREIEAIAIGLEETMDEEMINQGPLFIEYMTNELLKRVCRLLHLLEVSAAISMQWNSCHMYRNMSILREHWRLPFTSQAECGAWNGERCRKPGMKTA